MTRRLSTQAWRTAAFAAAILVSGCFGEAPDIKTKSIMENFKKQRQERIVADRNYKVGERYRVRPGEVMIRNKLYTLVQESAGGYRSELSMALVGDGFRLEIPAGLSFRIADRQLVNGRLANLVPLPQPPANASDVAALFVNDDGTLAPAILRGGRVVTFAKFEVAPEKARLTPETAESVKTSAGYVNYEVLYNSNGVFTYINCTPPRAPGTKPPATKPEPQAEGACGSGPHLDLTVVQYDSKQLDRASKANRAWYPVRGSSLELPGLLITMHEITATHVVFEVTKDDYAYVNRGF